MQRTGSKDGQRDTQREGQRIAKLLARAGVGSRRDIERMIEERRVALNGVALETPATLLTSLHGVTVDGEPVKAASPARLFVFHKPPGVLTAARDPKGRRTIYDVLPKDLPRLMPVGRLDLNTEGLLLLTTDGELKRQLELPSTGVERAYRARAYGQVTQAQLEDLIEGVEIEGVRYGQIDANIERRTGANVWVEMVLTEGKNREVRRVLEFLGLQVSRLIRTRYGPFVLADLPAGEIGEVRQADLVAFRQSLKLPKAAANAAASRSPIAVTGRAKPARAPAPAPHSAPSTGRPQRPARGGTTPVPTGRAAASTAPRARGAAPTTPVAAPVRSPRKPAPRVHEVREEIDTRRPRNEGTPAQGNEHARPAKPKRGAGWAKAKPKARPGKPKRPRRP